ncbi:MAG: DUF4058 family protein [Chloroflexi bacterium]|nr:DUF4058 family protein [Chloroflexota bacterium]MBI3761846.1 DUF4058 family protein [Chloroflexota bacterium]
MPTPFPGMDPWLEQPGVWDEAHDRLIVALADSLGPELHPRYRVAVERRVYVTTVPSQYAGRPDASVVQTRSPALPAGPDRAAGAVGEPVIVEIPYEEVVERYLEIRRPVTGEVVTAIEILSPKNKRPGDGRAEYERKRLAVVRSRTNLVEIDCLRAWQPMEFVWPGNGHAADYRILVSRSNQRPNAELYPFNVRDSIPRFRLPLLPDDREPIVDLKPMLDGIYDRAGFDLVIDYQSPPVPPLAEEDAAWAAETLRKRSLG